MACQYGTGGSSSASKSVEVVNMGVTNNLRLMSVSAVLIDTREEAKADLLDFETKEEAEKCAFAGIEADDKEGCETLGEYQDSLGGSQWYHVVEAQ